MVYAPRNYEELETVTSIVRAACCFAVGAELERIPMRAGPGEKQLSLRYYINAGGPVTPSCQPLERPPRALKPVEEAVLKKILISALAIL